MKILSSKIFNRQYAKLNDEQRESLEGVVWELRLNPTIGIEGKGRLRGFWYYNYKDLPVG